MHGRDRAVGGPLCRLSSRGVPQLAYAGRIRATFHTAGAASWHAVPSLWRHLPPLPTPSLTLASHCSHLHDPALNFDLLPLHESMVAATLGLQSARSSSACIASTSGRPWAPLRPAAAAAAAGVAGRRQQRAAAAGGRGMSSPVQAAVSEQAAATTNSATGVLTWCVGPERICVAAWQPAGSPWPAAAKVPSVPTPTAAATAACCCCLPAAACCRSCGHCEA